MGLFVNGVYSENFAALSSGFGASKHIYIAPYVGGSGNWAETGAAGGDATGVESYDALDSGTTPAVEGTVLLTVLVRGLNSGSGDVIDFAKEFHIYFMVGRGNSSVATGIAYVQLKSVNTIGALAAKGIGIKIANYTLSGDLHDGATLSNVSLSTVMSSAFAPYNIHIAWIPSVAARYYVNGVYKGSIETNLPTGTITTPYFVKSISNGTDYTSRNEMMTTGIDILQAH